MDYSTNWYACVRCKTPVDVKDVKRSHDMRMRGYCPQCEKIVAVFVDSNWNGEETSQSTGGS